MVRLKAKTRYAVLAALVLAEHYDGGGTRIKLKEIAARSDVPSKYLVHILISLKERALVNSARGAKGGYWLVRPPDRVSIAEVMAAVEPREEPRPEGDSPYEKAVNEIWLAAQNKKRSHLARITLADVLREARGSEGPAD